MKAKVKKEAEGRLRKIITHDLNDPQHGGMGETGEPKDFPKGRHPIGKVGGAMGGGLGGTPGSNGD